MIIVLLVIVILLILAALSTVCRTGHKGLQNLSNHAYAHRGLHGQGTPENSMKAFRKAAEKGYGVELDVHLLADGTLAVIHDSLLKRTTGADGIVEELTAEELRQYYLEGTFETIPLLSDVLELFAGKVPVIVELKCVNNNYKELCKKTCDLMDRYAGEYCMESFDPRCIYWLRKNRSNVIRGQLTENYFHTPGCKLPFLLKFVLRNQMLNFLTFPDFVAYRFSDRKTISNLLVRKVWKAQGVTWTLRTQEEYAAAVKECWIPIFENIKP